MIDLSEAKTRLAVARSRSRVDGVAAAEATADVLLELLDVVASLDAQSPSVEIDGTSVFVHVHLHEHDDGP